MFYSARQRTLPRKQLSSRPLTLVQQLLFIVLDNGLMPRKQLSTGYLTLDHYLHLSFLILEQYIHISLLLVSTSNPGSILLLTSKITTFVYSARQRTHTEETSIYRVSNPGSVFTSYLLIFFEQYIYISPYY